MAFALAPLPLQPHAAGGPSGVHPFFLREIALIATAWWTLHALVGRHLLRGCRGRTRALVATAIIASALAPIAAFLTGGGPLHLPAQLEAALQWFGFSIFGAAFFAAAVVMAWVSARRLTRRRDAPPDPGRRALLRRAGAAAAATVVVGAAVAGEAEARAVELSRVRIPLRRLPPQAEGFRIAHLSDLHAGYTISPAYVAALVARVNAERPDLVAITGDIADGDAARIAHLVAPLAGLRARHGVLACLGNHDYYFDARAAMAGYAAAGIDVLVNRHVVLDHDGARIVVGGVPDPLGWRQLPDHRPDLGAAFAGADASLRILLQHRPRIEDAAHALAIDLQLSGHLHGGHCFPLTWVIRLIEPYVAGLYAVRGLRLYVSRGTGYLCPANRLGSRPEIALIELTRAA